VKTFKTLLTVSLLNLGLLAGASTLPSLILTTAAKAQDVVIKNRWRGTVITANNGALSVGAAVNTNNQRWQLEPVGTFVRIRSAATGQHLHVERGPLELGQISPGWWSAMWSIERVGNDFVRIKNRWRENLYLNIETGRLEASQIQPGWWSAMWQLESGRQTASPGQPSANPATGGQDATMVLTLVNQHRAAGATCGGVSMPPVPPLRPHAGLNAAAAQWSEQMQQAGRLSHDRMVERINAVCAGANSWAENVFGGPISPQNAVAGWMNSPGHCRNIMSPNAEFIGIGRSSNSWWTQMFARGCQ
jgi:hypothetical protein